MSEVKKHFDKIAPSYDSYKKRYKYYYDNLKNLLTRLIPSNKVVLEVGCGNGHLLASLNTKLGYGIDISPQMIKIANSKYKEIKNLHFSTNNVLDFKKKEIDYIYLSDVIEHLENPEKMFLDIAKVMKKDTKLIITMVNPIWEPALIVWEKLGWKMPEGKHKRWKYFEIKNFLNKSGLKIELHDYYLLIPVKIPLITDLANRYLEKVFKKYAFIVYFVAKKA